VSRRAWLAVLAGAVLFPGIALAQLDPATVPEAKRTRAALYLQAREVPALLAAHAGRVLFLDVRTRAVFNLLSGETSCVHLVPCSP
jgi:hypothetical protein